MNLTIDRMEIENFKGIKSLTVEFGAVTNIYGRNGTGKTSIPDAFSWVLFNKDSAGNAPGTDAFKEKPLDEAGNEIHNVDTSVTLYCRIDGAPFVLRRVQRENWVKPRGRKEAVFQGNVSTYYINDVEVKLTDFKARIAGIASEDVFRLIATLSAFNGVDWKKRRSVLLSLSGADVDAALFEREEYSAIASELSKRCVTVDELRKIVTDQRKHINQEINMMPARIDEVKRMKPTFKEHEIDDAVYNEREAREDIEKVDKLIAELSAQVGAGSKRDQLLALESELLSIKRRANDDFMARKRRAETARDNANADMRRYAAAIADTQRRMDDALSRIGEIEKQRDGLRAQYKVEYEKKFVEPEQDRVCPTCGQALPDEQVQAAIDKARKAHASARKATLEKIQADGAKCNVRIEEIKNEHTRLNAEIDDLKGKLQIATDAFNEAVGEINALPGDIDYSSDTRYTEIVQQIEALRAAEKASPDARIKNLEEHRVDLTERLKRAQAIIAKRDTLANCESRIVELEERQKELGAQFADAEQLIMSIERFVADRCAMLEESINDKFPTVRWKLFDTQINGGIVDTCSCMIWCRERGALVTYLSANTGSQVNADIEVINVLSEHYGVTVPLFLDNKERVNIIGGVNGQIITLSVSTDDELRIERSEKQESEAA